MVNVKMSFAELASMGPDNEEKMLELTSRCLIGAAGLFLSGNVFWTLHR